jgi:hypothetical protein
MGAVAIGKSLEVNTALSVLHLCLIFSLIYLADDQIGDTGVAAIARSLEKNAGLHKLYLGRLFTYT